MKDYNWPGQFAPFAHQKITSTFLAERPRAFCFNEAGTGKTASVIWAADYLMAAKAIRRVLVVCPLSIMKAAWQQDLYKFACHRTCDIAYGDRRKRAKVISGDAEFVIINFDGLAIVKEEVIAGGFDLIVIDESAAYKNPATARWKVLRDITKVVKGLWMLTGTPAAQSPVDAYGLAKLVNPKNTPLFFGHFRDQVMIKLDMYRWIPKANAQQIVHNILQPAIRFEKDQCLDLPEVIYVERDAPLTPQQMKYYKLLKDTMMIQAAGEEISSANAATSLNKLLQLSCGAMYTEDKEVIEFDVSNRLQVILEVIEESSHKVLIFVPFTHTIELLRDYLTKHKVPCEVINGAVPVHKRSDIVQDFQTTDRIKVLIIQPQAASHGLTLTAANTVIWYAPVMSVETYIQANARINRPGQKNAMTIVHIKGSEVETKLYTMLRNNIGNHEKIIDLYRREIEETT